MNIKSFSELQSLPTFDARYDYLRLGGEVGLASFGFDRYLNQKFYRSREWLRARDAVIVRDRGCDLSCSDREIHGLIIVHHMNSVTLNDLMAHDPKVLDPEFLICVSSKTHLAIHYGDKTLLPEIFIPRQKGDTLLWASSQRR